MSLTSFRLGCCYYTTKMIDMVADEATFIQLYETDQSHEGKPECFHLTRQCGLRPHHQ